MNLILVVSLLTRYYMSPCNSFTIETILWLFVSIYCSILALFFSLQLYFIIFLVNLNIIRSFIQPFAEEAGAGVERRDWVLGRRMKDFIAPPTNTTPPYLHTQPRPPTTQDPMGSRLPSRSPPSHHYSTAVPENQHRSHLPQPPSSQPRCPHAGPPPEPLHPPWHPRPLTPLP